MTMNKRRAFIGAVIVAAAATAITWWQIQSRSKVTLNRVASQQAPEIRSFALDLVTGQVIPTTPTTNPLDPYDPIPLRIGTVGATVYHRPFCPYAKRSLANHGAIKRINYWTREQVADSGRPPDAYCIAGVFDCSAVEPADFVTSNNDPWCGANIRASRYDVTGVDAAVAGKTLCILQGRIGMFVDDPDHCVDGQIRGSDPTCDEVACSTCTINCPTACIGCVKVTMAPLNKVTLGMGDANRDGQTDRDDYLYYHECYSGPVAATPPCQNVFDFDGDADVDVTDFDLFVQAYNTGNESWAAANHPTASVNPPKPELPLRVSTEGSIIYHRIWCPAVNNSWQVHGMNLRRDYYSWNHVEASNNVPDTNICFPGTRDNPSGSLQHCDFDDDGDGILNCVDACPGDNNPCCPDNCWTAQTFPLSLEGVVAPESGDITLTLGTNWKLAIPTATTIDLVITVFDADQAAEGRMFVNGTQVATLFGTTLPGNAIVGNVTITTPIALYHDGINTITFWHDSADGYRVDNVILNFN